MVVRCFARRHLVPPRRLAQQSVVHVQQQRYLQFQSHQYAASASRQEDGGKDKETVTATLSEALMSHAARRPLLSTSTPIGRGARSLRRPRQDEPANAEGSTSAAKREQKARSTFSSPISERWQEIAGGASVPLESIDQSQPHPYEAALLHELELIKTEPSSKRREGVWQLYLSAIGAASEPVVTDNGQALSSEAKGLRDRTLHRRVLMAIAPYPSHVTNKQRADEMVEDEVDSGRAAGLVRYRHEDNAKLKSKRGVGTYLSRARYILKQMHAIDPAELPRIVDINNVLEQLAPKGAMAPMSSIWAQLTGKKTLDAGFALASADTLGIATEAVSSRAPNRRTYIHLMVGITRHLASQLDRANKVQPDDRLRHRDVRGRGDGDFDPHSHPVSQARRQAILLASQRTASLLDEMVSRQVPLDKIVCDLALRILRMSGNMGSFKILVREAYKIDLDDPEVRIDGERSSFVGDVGSPDIHVLNTIVMALGEHSTARNMVAAYEAMTKPLRRMSASRDAAQEDVPIGSDNTQGPDTQTHAQQAFGEKSIFALDWQTLFRWRDDPSLVEAVAQEDISESEIDASSIYAIWPNRKTFTSLIQHLAQSPSLVQMLDAVEGQERLSGKSAAARRRAAQREAEHQERKDGTFIPLACSYLREALDVQEVEVARLARELSVPLDRIDNLAEQIKAIEDKMDKKQRDFSVQASFLRRYKGEALADEMLPPESSSQDSVIKDVFALIAEAVEDSNVAKKAISKGIPSFTPPLLHIDHTMMQPLVSRASRQRDTKQLSWLRQWSRKAIALHLAELRVLGVAIAQWDGELQRLRQLRRRDSSSVGALEPLELRNLIDALRQQSRQVGQRMRNLTASHLDRITGRLAGLQSQRRERANRRKVRAEEAKVQEEQAAEQQRQAQRLRQREREYQREETAAQLLASDAVEHDQHGERAHVALQPEPIRS